MREARPQDLVARCVLMRQQEEIVPMNIQASDVGGVVRDLLPIRRAAGSVREGGNINILLVLNTMNHQSDQRIWCCGGVSDERKVIVEHFYVARHPVTKNLGILLRIC